MAVPALWISPQFWSTRCCHMLFNSWGFPNCCLTVEDGKTSSTSSGEPGPDHAVLQTLLECLRVLTATILEMSLTVEGDFAGFESIPPSKSLFCSRAIQFCPSASRANKTQAPTGALTQRDGEDSQHPHVRRFFQLHPSTNTATELPGCSGHAVQPWETAGSPKCLAGS